MSHQVGDIVFSVLALDTFSGSHEGRWVECDGMSYPDTRWHSLTGTPKVPDMRDRYPRVASPQNAVNTVMEDAIANHVHTLEGFFPMDDAQGGATGDDRNIVPRNPTYGNPSMATSGVIGARVANETRPKTYVVNCFLRID